MVEWHTQRVQTPPPQGMRVRVPPEARTFLIAHRATERTEMIAHRLSKRMALLRNWIDSPAFQAGVSGFESRWGC